MSCLVENVFRTCLQFTVYTNGKTSLGPNLQLTATSSCIWCLSLACCLSQVSETEESDCIPSTVLLVTLVCVGETCIAVEETKAQTDQTVQAFCTLRCLGKMTPVCLNGVNVLPGHPLATHTLTHTHIYPKNPYFYKKRGKSHQLFFFILVLHSVSKMVTTRAQHVSERSSTLLANEFTFFVSIDY